jgi:hexosaminidase
VNRVEQRWEAAYGRAYQIQVSSDATTWTTVFSTATGDGAVDDLTVSGSGRYVRMLGTARATMWGYSLWEMEVYGS